jgi:tRNA threonylcarbamoyladenosine modification (KEOPS) complex  Pcc1 subunit
MVSNLKTLNVKLSFKKHMYKDHIDAIRLNLDNEMGRSRIEVKEDEDFFHIYIEASDTVAIRAALGSITKWILVADRIIKEVN